MLKIKYTPQAQRDIKDILKYTTQTWGNDHRARYKQAIQSTVTQIASHPLIGKNRDELLTGCYSYPMQKPNRHIVFYKIFADSIHVLRILHDSMEAERYLSEP